MNALPPPSRVGETVSEVAGLRFADPYRWLEADTAEVSEWQRAQASHATSELSRLLCEQGTSLDAVRSTVTEYDAGARPDLPKFAGGMWFRVDSDASTGGRAQLVCASTPFGDGRALIALDELVAAGESAVLSWMAPSPDGAVVALGICTDGSEHNRISLVEVATGRVRADAPTQTLHSAWAGGVSWWPDSTGFTFFALTGSPQEFAQAVFSHRLGVAGDAGRTTVEEIPIPEGSREYTLVQFSRDGRWAVASHRVGSPIPIAVRDLSREGSPWLPFVTDCVGTVAGHIVGDRYFAVTDVGAGRRRVVAIPLELAARHRELTARGENSAAGAAQSSGQTDPNNPDNWIELMPETDMVLRGITPVGQMLYLSGFDHTAARVLVLDRDGSELGAVPLPANGAVHAPFFALTALAQTSYASEFLFAFSTLTTSWGVYSHRHGKAGLETVVSPAVNLAAEVSMEHAIAGDGTAIPFHVVRPLRSAGAASAAGAGGEQPAPVLISAYGAANVPTLPSYQPDLAAFVASGGTLVQAYLRGGGEYGTEWYLGAHRERRHVRDDDLVAVAEHLIATGLTSPAQLALTGGSDGGLMCGVAVTKRPDLWRAVLPRAPLLDLIGGLREPYLDFVIRKAWADPEIPGEVLRLAANSPYELVAPGEFPLVYAQAGATDPRCPPAQARKFVARLQAAQRGSAPILLHVFENAGHGAGTMHEVIIEQDTEWLACLVGALGL
ncbi:MAG: prolyl oligopeptidase family serine peptidase [Actinobacteria bacterium]|nr:prolyl oligopeptidase family serine peptidase [Actinomycetota bacterium]